MDTSSDTSSDTSIIKSTNNSEKKEFNNAVFMFYKLKNQYQYSIDEEKKNLIKIKELSWREKRREYKRYKPKCINCKRAVGTVFSVGKNSSNSSTENETESDVRILRAYCGDRLNPCPLNIEITSNIFNTKEYLNDEENNLTNDKTDVIKYKNDLLFGYLSENEVVDKFEELKEQIKSETSNYEFLLSQYNEVVNNNEKLSKINKNTKEIYELIDKLRNTMDKYEKTDNIRYVDDAVTLYVNELTPKIKQNNQLKYKVEYVEFNEYDDTYKLVQLPYTVEDLEASLDNKVVNLVTGLAKFKPLNK
uniref:Uncharacterized protein n=1 Tax=viral metagenome TaxID=1070528 RepID=A0A6C0EFV2_9ZZZZ